MLVALSTVSFAGDDKALKPGQEPNRSKQLFEGSDLSQWVIHGTKDQADWPLQEGAMVSAKHDIESSAKFKSFVLHIEFNEPKLGPESKGQDRGNSGIYLQGRYELQVLDSYNNEPYPNGACGACGAVGAATSERGNAIENTLQDLELSRGGCLRRWGARMDKHQTVVGEVANEDTHLPEGQREVSRDLDDGQDLCRRELEDATTFRGFVRPASGSDATD